MTKQVKGELLRETQKGPFRVELKVREIKKKAPAISLLHIVNSSASL